MQRQPREAKHQVQASPRIPLLYAPVFAVVGGYCLDIASPAVAWWPAAFIGVIFIVSALWNQRARHGVWLGALAGMAFWLPHIFWLTLYLGPVPWLGLSGVMISWFALFGAAAAASTRGLSLLTLRRSTRVTAQTLTVTGLWVLREVLQSSLPYDGFGWGRLAHTQSAGPIAELVSWVGFAGLTGVIVLLAIFPVAFVASHPRGSLGSRLRQAAVSVVIVGFGFGTLALVPAAKVQDTGTIRIAAVQGNSQSGVFDDRESGDVIDSHIAATRTWLATDPEPVDVVVWPENSAEFNLPKHSDHREKIMRLTKEAKAPIVAGTILQSGTRAESRYTNSAVVVDSKTGFGDQYDKRHPVPFAEYMPHRAFYRSLAPDLVDLVQLEYEHGTTSSVVEVAGIRAGVVICFDVIFDDMATEMVSDGAQIIFAPTNNADFGFTDQSEQQLEIARLRAIEVGRTLVNISTVATSEVIDRQGTVLDSVDQWESGVMEADVMLHEGETPAIRSGSTIAFAWSALGILGLATAVVRSVLLQRSTSRAQ